MVNFLLVSRNHRLVKWLFIAIGLVVTLLCLVKAQRTFRTAPVEANRGTDKHDRPSSPPPPPPPITDPFPLLATSSPPPIPSWNIPKKDLYKQYGIDYAPPLLIGFTRNWPILLQAVVSYITAGWPADQIYVVENTGTQWANARGKLSLQNPFYLNHEQLKKLGVNVIQTPVLLTFAQLQNFYIHLSHQRNWPYYFWSHMDVIVVSHEGGREGGIRKAGSQGYVTIYEECLMELNKTLATDNHWALRFFSYDALTLVNRAASDEVGGWDANIPYYITDCDMYQRFAMKRFSMGAPSAGVVFDTNTVLKDLLAFYRDPSVDIAFVDPNPPADGDGKGLLHYQGNLETDDTDPSPLAYWRKLKLTAETMQKYKREGTRGRNTWQASQQGGQGEPYYYPARGISVAFEMTAQLGRDMFVKKWGQASCELIKEGHLNFEDQWRPESNPP